MKKHNQRQVQFFNRRAAEKLIGRIASEQNGRGFYRLRDKFLEGTAKRMIFKNELEAAMLFELVYRESKPDTESTDAEITKTAGYLGKRINDLHQQEIIPSSWVMPYQDISQRLNQMRSDYRKLGL